MSVVSHLNPHLLRIAALAVPLLALAPLLEGQRPHSQSRRVGNPSPVPSVKFADVTEKLGIHFKHEASPTKQKYLLETMGSGVALFDCDNDGRLDIFFVNGARIDDPMPKGALPRKDGPRFSNRLYHQNPDGTFTDITEKSGLAGTGYGMGVAVGDFDNDGNEDLFVTGFPSNHLYHNNGNCTFTEVTETAGVAGSGWSTSAAFVDYDHDGLLDLIVVRYLDWSFEDNPYCGEHLPGHRAYCHPDSFPPVANLLYHNEGGGKFKEVSQQAGLAQYAGKGLGVAIADYDHDGRIDICIANDSIREFLFHNKGNGKFEEVAFPAGVAVDANGSVFAGMGIDFADYDNDGWADIVITALSEQKYPLYHNQGDGTFAYATDSSGLGRISLPYGGWGLRFMDYDNDGRKDLFIAQGHVLDTVQLTFPHLRYLQPPILLRNIGGGKFEDVSAQSGRLFHNLWAGRGLAVGDIDNDGNLDVVITTNNGYAHVLHNQGGNARNWLLIKLRGRKSNRDGIGAVVKVVPPSGLTQYATVTTTGSYLSASDRRVHFGLGSESSLRYLEVHWPSGILQRIEKVKANQILEIVEPEFRP